MEDSFSIKLVLFEIISTSIKYLSTYWLLTLQYETLWAPIIATRVAYIVNGPMKSSVQSNLRNAYSDNGLLSGSEFPIYDFEFHTFVISQQLFIADETKRLHLR